MGDRHFWQNLFTPSGGREMAQALDRSRWAACFNYEVSYEKEIDGSERFSDLPEVTQLRGRLTVTFQVCLAP